MNKAVIIGASGHGRVIASILADQFGEILFVDANPYDDSVLDQKVLFQRIDDYRGYKFFLGIGNNEIRTILFSQLNELGIICSNCIAEQTFIARDAMIEQGVVICPGAVVGSKAVLHNNTIVNTLSSVDHDCILGENSQVTAGVTFGGNTVVGENCFFGIKSATIPGIKVGNNSKIMAGSVLYKDVPDNVLVGGNPARLIRAVE